MGRYIQYPYIDFNWATCIFHRKMPSFEHLFAEKTIWFVNRGMDYVSFDKINLVRPDSKSVICCFTLNIFLLCNFKLIKLIHVFLFLTRCIPKLEHEHRKSFAVLISDTTSHARCPGNMNLSYLKSVYFMLRLCSLAGFVRPTRAADQSCNLFSFLLSRQKERGREKTFCIFFLSLWESINCACRKMSHMRLFWELNLTFMIFQNNK